MRRPLLSAFLSLIVAPVYGAADAAGNALDSDHAAEARALVQDYVGQLKPALMNAMTNGGPVNAVAVCAEEAPRIAASLSTSSGWDIRRVSLKPRNHRTAKPDAFTRDVLEAFDARLAGGEPIASLEHAEIHSGEFRYLKAQPTEPLCLTCHGTDIAPAVSAAIRRFYPEDAATGYRPGEIRGAFYLRRAIVEE